MRSGALRNSITIRRQVQVGVTPLNEPNIVWQDWRWPLVEILPRRGGEKYSEGGEQRFSREYYRFRAHYSEFAGVDTTMKLVHESQVYDIKALLPDEMKRSDAIIEATLDNAVIGGAAALAISILDAINVGSEGIAYVGFSLTASGGTAPYVFSKTGNLPAGMSLNASTGAVSGTPTQDGEFPVVFKVTDAAGATASLPSVALSIGSTSP